jgi:DNA replication factor GINS
MTLTAEIAKKLSIEERALYNVIHKNSDDFINQIFHDEK